MTKNYLHTALIATVILLCLGTIQSQAQIEIYLFGQYSNRTIAPSATGTNNLDATNTAIETIVSTEGTLQLEAWMTRVPGRRFEKAGMDIHHHKLQRRIHFIDHSSLDVYRLHLPGNRDRMKQLVPLNAWQSKGQNEQVPGRIPELKTLQAMNLKPAIH